VFNLFRLAFLIVYSHDFTEEDCPRVKAANRDCLLNLDTYPIQVMVMELLRQWGHSGFMDHVAKVEEFYRGRRDRMMQAAEKHLTGNYKLQYKTPTNFGSVQLG